MEKDIKYSILLQIYGKLLTERQNEIMVSYYDYDLSLAEISENLEISRQAVLDSVRKCCQLLDEYEEKLKIFSTKMFVTEELSKLKKDLESDDKQAIIERIEKINDKIQE